MVNKLYPAILEELENMDDVIIISETNSETILKTILEIGKIVIDYKTRKIEKPRKVLRFLKPKLVDEPLTNLTEIMDRLEKNPDIGEPVEIEKNKLEYNSVENVLGFRNVEEFDGDLDSPVIVYAGYKVFVSGK